MLNIGLLFIAFIREIIFNDKKSSVEKKKESKLRKYVLFSFFILSTMLNYEVVNLLFSFVEKSKELKEEFKKDKEEVRQCKLELAEDKKIMVRLTEGSPIDHSKKVKNTPSTNDVNK